MTTKSRGFTLVEMMTVVGLIAIVAAIAIPTMLKATRNASVSGVSFDLMLRMQGLRPRALADQRTYLAVFVDASGNDGTDCNANSPARQCAQLYVLTRPLPTWRLGAFSPTMPGSGAEVADVVELRGIRFALDKAGKDSPLPFGATIKSLDPAAVATCGGRSCMAVRFAANGDVTAELPGGNDPAARGIALVLGTGRPAVNEPGADTRALMVAAPSGIVKAYSVF